MAYQFITQHTATFFHDRPPGHSYAGICIHWWGDPAQHPTFDGTINYLVYGGARNSASVHYVAEAGKVACLLDPDTQLCWGQGDGAAGYGNNYFLAIECNPRASDGDYQTVAELVRELRSVYGRNGSLPLMPHRFFTSTDCPGVWDLARIDRIARGLPAPASPAPVKPASSTPVTTVKKKPVTTPSGYVRPTGLSWVTEKGDSLAKIAAWYGITVPALANYNKIIATASLRIGLRLHIPGPLWWVVDPGDTLGAIAKHYGLTADVIAARNGMNVNAVIYPGQRLRIL